MTIYKTLTSPLGDMLLAANDDGISTIWFIGQKYADIAPTWRQAPEDPLLIQAEQQLGDYFAGRRSDFDLPLAPRGTAFQRRVWDALLHIPYGETSSYGALAGALGVPAAARAVGAAVGRNPLGIVVPCHRVVGSKGALTGYAAGLERKRWLLALEQGAVQAGLGL